MKNQYKLWVKKVKLYIVFDSIFFSLTKKKKKKLPLRKVDPMHFTVLIQA